MVVGADSCRGGKPVSEARTREMYSQIATIGPSSLHAVTNSGTDKVPRRCLAVPESRALQRRHIAAWSSPQSSIRPACSRASDRSQQDFVVWHQGCNGIASDQWFHRRRTDPRGYFLAPSLRISQSPTFLELRDISALVELKNGWASSSNPSTVFITSRASVNAENDHIIVNSTSGYEAQLSEATVNMASGDTVSESRVEVKLPRVNQGQSFGSDGEWCLDPVWRRRGDNVQSGPGTSRSARLSTSRAPARASVQPPPSHPPVPRPDDGKTCKSSGSRQRV
jgi:hypothetical protein